MSASASALPSPPKREAWTWQSRSATTGSAEDQRLEQGPAWENSLVGDPKGRMPLFARSLAGSRQESSVALSGAAVRTPFST
jgi:hypothetical protein